MLFASGPSWQAWSGNSAYFMTAASLGLVLTVGLNIVGVETGKWLTNAGAIATTLGLFPKPVVEAKAALFVASAGKFGTAPASGMVAAGGPEYLVPAGPPGAIEDRVLRSDVLA